MLQDTIAQKVLVTNTHKLVHPVPSSQPMASPPARRAQQDTTALVPLSTQFLVQLAFTANKATTPIP